MWTLEANTGICDVRSLSFRTFFSNLMVSFCWQARYSTLCKSWFDPQPAREKMFGLAKG